jgi:hypothetical protein
MIARRSALATAPLAPHTPAPALPTVPAPHAQRIDYTPAAPSTRCLAPPQQIPSILFAAHTAPALLSHRTTHPQIPIALRDH